MKNKANIEANLSPLLLTREVLADADTESLSVLPTEAALKQRIRRVRRKGQPNIPASFEDIIDIPRRYRELDGDNFVLFDNGVESENRVILFGTVNALRDMSQSDY